MPIVVDIPQNIEKPSWSTYPRYLSAEVEEHGGGCCGILHLMGFPNLSPNAHHKQATITPGPNDTKALSECVLEWVRDGIRSNYGVFDGDDICDDEDCDCGMPSSVPSSWECVVEAALAGYQFQQWHDVLIAAGFVVVTEFMNSNSENVCRIYHLNTKELSL